MSKQQSIPRMPAGLDPDEFDADAPRVVREWRLMYGLDDLERFASAVHLHISTVAEIEEGVRPVTRSYLYQQIGGRLRTYARKRDRQLEATATQRLAREQEDLQTTALGVQLAKSLWGSQSAADAWTILEGAIFERLTPEYWTERRLLLALMRALEINTYALQRRYADRDRFPYSPELTFDEMIP